MTSTEGTTTTCPRNRRHPTRQHHRGIGVRLHPLRSPGPGGHRLPLIPAATVFRAPAGSPPYDHTSIIATLRARFNLGPLGNRDAIAPHLGPVLSLSQPRRDDPLRGITSPTAADPVLQAGSAPIGEAPSSFLEAKAIAAAKLPVPSEPIENPEQTVAALSTAANQYAFIQDRLQAWEAAGKPLTNT
jgi:phospholipase C